MDTKGASILLVDDDPQVLKAVRLILEGEGYRVIPYADPVAALESFMVGEYDLVLSDIKMPKMSGVELLEHLRDLDPELPVILHTGYAELETAVSAVKGDAFDYLVKPVDPDILIKSVSRAILFRKYAQMEKKYLEGLKEEGQASTVKLFEMVEELEKARDEAQAASKLKSEILANMSHEFRTPLNGIIGLSDVLLGMEVPAQVHEYLTMIADSAASLNAMLSNLLELSLLLADPVVLKQEEFSLDELLAAFDARFRPTAEVRGLELNFFKTPGVPSRLFGDRNRLEQALKPLLDNALKFIDKGEVSLTVVQREATEEGVGLDFVVSDTGIGIEPDKIAHIFESFRQADGSLTRRHGGAGLGLAITQRLLALLDGEITVESIPGKGSIFTVSLDFQVPQGI